MEQKDKVVGQKGLGYGRAKMSQIVVTESTGRLARNAEDCKQP